MKKLIVFFSLIGILSCKSALEEVPIDFIAPESFFNTQADAEAAIAGAYSTTTGPQTDIYINYLNLEGMHTDYITPKGSWTSVGNIDQPLDAVHQGRVQVFWDLFYNRIMRVNSVLDHVPNISEMNEDRRSVILAEARFLRSMYYFNLVRSFGAIPLRTSAITDLDGIAVPKSSVQEICDFIIADLLVAENDLPTNVGAETGRPSKWAAKMLLAQVYLDREMWTEAAGKAEEIILSGQYELVQVQHPDDFYKIFAVETSAEDIMSIHYSPTASHAFVDTHHGSGTPYNRGFVAGFFMPPNMNSFLSTWHENDMRRDFNLYTSYIDDNGNEVSLAGTAEPIRFKKYIKDENGIAIYSTPLFRYVEAFLIYAEAACMANGSVPAAALERLNVVKRRAYGHNPYAPSPIDYQMGMTPSVFRDAVLQERAYEFVLEPRRWWDLKRVGNAKEVLEAASGKTFHPSRYLYPIPQTEIDNNPALTQADQNPGY